RLVAACTEALPALLAASHPAGTPPGDTTAAAPAPPVPRRLEFAGATLSGLVGLDAGRTGRLLLFPEGGGLFLFTGERLGHTPGRAAPPATASAFAEDGAPAGPWPRLRAALDRGGGASLALTLGLHGGEASGFLCRDGRHVAVAAAHAALGPADAPLAHVGLELELVDGRRLRIAARALPRLPVIRARGPAPVRVGFAAC